MRSKKNLSKILKNAFIGIIFIFSFNKSSWATLDNYVRYNYVKSNSGEPNEIIVIEDEEKNENSQPIIILEQNTLKRKNVNILNPNKELKKQKIFIKRSSTNTDEKSAFGYENGREQYNLAEKYRVGRDVQKNEDKGFELYIESAYLGLSRAILTLKNMSNDALSSHGNMDTVNPLLKAYCEAYSQWEKNPCARRDKIKADDFHAKARHLGFSQAENELGAFKHGLGGWRLEENNVRATDLYTKASNQSQKMPALLRTNGLRSTPKNSKPPVKKPSEKTSSNISFAFAKKSHQDECKVSHVSGSEEHFNLLKKSLDSAKKEILITTHSITWIPSDVFDLLKDAVCRNVKIHIIYNHNIPEKVEDFFMDTESIRLENNKIHAKYLVVDRKIFVIGSFNWLDFTKTNDDDIEECSFKISKNENYVNRLRGKVYSEIISNRKGPSEKEWDFLKLPISPDSSNMLLLTTLFDHENFLLSACRDAKRKIEVYSPFVTYKNAIKRINNIADILNKDAQSNVRLHLFVGEKYYELSNFIKNHRILRKNTDIDLEYFHRKTLVIDDELISEGSFNWLSSASNLESEYHNHDASLVLKGPVARDIINNDPYLQE